MILLAGLMGLMAIGATAFYGLDYSFSTDAENGNADPEQTGATSEIDQTGGNNGLTTLLDSDESPGEMDWGDEADNTVQGTSGHDQLNGYAGDDQVLGLDGDDRLNGDVGDDTLYGDGGDDTLHGEAGNDALIGGAGDDQMYGHDGSDTLNGEDGDDSLVGSAGDDVLSGDQGDDALHGDLGDDTLDGGAGSDTLFGGWGNDVINGAPNGQSDEDVDFLNGGGGDDLIIAGGSDIVTAGDGADTIAIGDWLTEEHQAEITDFSANEDRLMVVYDDLNDEDPHVSLEQDEETPDRQHLVLNGVRIAAVDNAEDLTLGHIFLIGQTALSESTAA